MGSPNKHWQPIYIRATGAKHPDVPVCIQPTHVMAGGNTNISVGHIDSKFGISIHQLPHLVRIVENTKMNIGYSHAYGFRYSWYWSVLYAAEILFDAARNFKTLNS
jgi:diaminopimelate decarboxylase